MGIKRRSNTLPSDFSSSSFSIFIHLSFPHLSSYYIQSKPKTTRNSHILRHPGTFPSYRASIRVRDTTKNFIASLPITSSQISLSHTLPCSFIFHPSPRLRHRSSSILQTFKYAFNTNPQCTLPSLPPSCHVGKITLLLPSYGTPSPICPPHHLTTNARIQRQHLGRSIFDIRQPKWRR